MERIRTVHPSVLMRDNLLRFVLPYRTLTRGGDLAPFCLILAKDRLEAHPPAGEFIDKFLFYNASKNVHENIKKVISEVFRDAENELLERIGIDVETKIKGVEQIKKYLDGATINKNVLYGAFLREQVHFGKVLLRAGQDFGGIRYQIRSLAASTFIPYIFPVRIEDVLEYYMYAYEKIGRPYVARASEQNRDLIVRVKKYNELQVDDVLDLIVDSIGSSRLLAVSTHIFLVGKDGALHIDAKRCLSIPPPARIRDIMIVQSQDVGVVALFYDMSVSDMEKYVRILTSDIVKRYKRGLVSERELAYLPQKLSKIVYGATVTEEEQIGEQLRITLFGGGGETTEETTLGSGGTEGGEEAGAGLSGKGKEEMVGGEQV